MPLPSVAVWSAPQCTAMAKGSRERCKNPAAFKCRTCRVHGARRPGTIKKGADHPNYKTGAETLVAKAARSARLAELRDLEATMVLLGALDGPRWRGRKPKAAT